MAFILNTRRPQCFYCGKRSTQRIIAKAQQFECEGCQAVNYFDQNGEITDPPLSVSSHPIQSPLRYARSQSHSPPPTTGNVFCDTCLRNQHLYKENLALYLPDPQHPRYREYVASLPSYKERLEERYPQVCPDCAPRAREKIKQAGYVAKTDHLRRMMAQTRTGRVPLRAGVWWRLWIIRLGGFVWWSSATAQLFWHLLGAVTCFPKEATEYKSKDLSLLSLATSCSQQAWLTHKVDLYCVESSSKYLPALLLLSILTVWWNPHLSDKYHWQRKGRMKGLVDYTIQCVVLLIFRAVGWAVLRRLQVHQVDNDIYKAGHIFMVVFIAFSMIYGSTLVKLDTNPIVSFHIPDDQILPDIPERDRRAPSSLLAAPKSPAFTEPIASRVEADMKHAVQAQRQQTGLTEYDHHLRSRSTIPQPYGSTGAFAEGSHSIAENPWSDPDAMDWIPSQDVQVLASSNFRTRVSHQVQQTALDAGQSPFEKRVPAAPPSRMRHPKEHVNPPAVQPFQKASEAQRKDFLRGMAESRNRKPGSTQPGFDGISASAFSPEDMTEGGRSRIDVQSEAAARGASRFGLTATNSGAGSAGDFKLAPQRLFLKSDDRDTGLENMFDEVFSFRDEPNTKAIAGVPSPPHTKPQAYQQTTRGSSMFGLDHRGQVLSENSNTRQQRAPIQGDGWSTLLLGFVPAVILGVAAVAVKLLKLRTEDRPHEL